MATGGNDISSDEIINIKCSFCAEDNRTREAEKYCVECRDYYCLSCATTHTKFPAMREHKLLDKADFRSQGLDGSLPSFPTQRCTQHLSKVVSMFCRDHNEVACPSCMFLAHRSCTNVHSIAEETDSLYNTTQLTNMKQKILTGKKTMEDMKKAKENQVKQLKKAFDQEVKSVKAFRQELQTLLDSMEQESISELKKEFDIVEKCLKDELTGVNELLDAINTAASQLRKSEGNKAQEFISVKTAEKVVGKADDVENEQQKKTEENISFSADQNIKAFLKQKQTLGQVSSNKQVFHSKKNSLYKVKQHREVDIMHVNDSIMCSIFGSCIIQDGSVLLTDYANNKLKRFDMSTNKVKDDIMFKASPCAVCLVSRTEAAVTLTNNTVQFLSLGNKLTATHSLTMKHKCYGLAYNDGKLFVSDHINSMYIYDMNGQELRRISTDTSGNAIFKDPVHITFSVGNDRAFIANESGNTGVVILDIQGNYLSTLTDPTLSGSHGLCTDGNNLFVCGHRSDNIVQIGQNNKMLGELAKVQNPLSLCFDHRNSRLITHNISNKITVLDLE